MSTEQAREKKVETVSTFYSAQLSARISNQENVNKNKKISAPKIIAPSRENNLNGNPAFY